MARPRSITLLCLLLAGLAFYSGLGLAAAWRFGPLWERLPLSVPGGYFLARAAIWSGVFGALAVGLWLGRPWGRWGVALAWPAYLAWGWAERLFLARASDLQLTVGWALAVDAVSLIFVGYALRRRPPRSRSAP
jgi:hypothetical protein